MQTESSPATQDDLDRFLDQAFKIKNGRMDIELNPEAIAKFGLDKILRRARERAEKLGIKPGRREGGTDAAEKKASEYAVPSISGAMGRASVEPPSDNSTANSEGKSSSSSATQTSSSTANARSEEDSVTNSREVSSGETSTNVKTKPSRLAGIPHSPSEATATAIALKRGSDKAAAAAEYGRAFELAAKAWEAVQTFPEDVACQKMSGELERRMDDLGTLANAQRGSDLKRDKPLIVR